jgi:hypothetical protein
MNYKNIIPSQDWLCVLLPVPPQNELVVWPVAVWAQKQDDKIIGLISVPGGGQDDQTMGRVCSLVSPPSVYSVYKHISELNENEQAALKSGKPLKIEPSVS